MSDLSPKAEQILAAARRFVIAGGYNGFSFADIAEVVGIRKPSIHHHFPTKAEMMRVLVSRYRVEAKVGLAQLEGQVPDPLDQLRAYTGYWKACIGDASLPFCVCALLASERPVLPPDVAAEVTGYFRLLSGWLTQVMERGEKAGRLSLTDSPQVEAESFMASVHGAMLSARAYNDPAMFGAIIDPLIARIAAPSSKAPRH